MQTMSYKDDNKINHTQEVVKFKYKPSISPSGPHTHRFTDIAASFNNAVC